MEPKRQEDEAVGGPVVLEATALTAITRAEVDVQITTALAHPRSLAKFIKRAKDMATLDEETAASCIYNRPVGKNKDGSVKYVDGKSIRLAEIVGVCYGNLRVGSMLLEQTERMVKARGYAHDLESNYACSAEVIESTVDKYGNPYSERMRIVVAKAVLAKARRDVTFQVVPGAICKGIEEAARKTAIGDASTFDKRLGAVIEWIGKLGISMDRVLAALGVKTTKDITFVEFDTLTGIKTAIKDGDVTVDEAFPPLAGSKNTVEKPQAKSDKKAAAEGENAKRSLAEQFLDLQADCVNAPEAKAKKYKAALEKYCKAANKSPEEFATTDYGTVVPVLRECLK